MHTANSDVVLGAATPGAITSANIITSARASTIVEATAPLGYFDVNLDHTTTAHLTTIEARGATAGTGIVLLGANEVSYLDAISATAGGFAFHDTLAFDLYGPITATGQTVDLRSAHAIGPVSTGIIAAQTLTGSSVGGANFGAANQVVQLGDFTNTGGLLKLLDDRSLTITEIVLSMGTLALTSHAGMTFASTGKVTADGAGDAIVLASDGTFTNARGADAVTASNAVGRWLIYPQAVGNASGSTAANSFNGLVGKSFYGSAISTRP
ncbi:hypothetical protein [Caulobacter hibisci]|uniref:hypothetical protein n=1 Tax=Caulobacter hibisci TaxID=2035993 RepID=UPI0018E379B8|nr:hypothetical protein [Caulobacter hibisci]